MVLMIKIDGYNYLKENICNCKENGNVLFLDDEMDYVLEKTIQELEIVFESLKG